MKIRCLLLISILTLLFVSCEDSNTENNSKLELSESSFQDIDSDGVTLTVNITSSDSWVAASSSTWCKLVPNKGASNQPLGIVVETNLETTERSATIAVTSSGIKKVITVTQLAAGHSTDPEAYHYELPIIFHVLYKNSSDPKQYISPNRLTDILKTVNKLYKNKIGSVDMNLTFTLASTGPDGKDLTTPGVEYTLWPESYPIDCDAFMSDNTRKYVSYLWDPNQYINVMIYNFTNDNSGFTTLGIAHLPFSTKGSTFLEGLNPVESPYLTLNNLKFPYCVSINSLYINEQSSGNTYNSADVTVTMAHELGHYLGLHHVFSEDDNGTYDGCIDSDYCKDTPTYNKEYYDQWSNTQLALGVHALSTLAVRENCMTDQTFTSHNIMDYAFSYSDQFSNDQRNRIRHVLTYSPLIPGPKKGQTQTRTAAEGPLDLPILIRR